jgi:hypothetical protein
VTDNPYKAPASNVEAPEARPPKPPSVVLAVRLLWAILAVDMLSYVPGVRTGAWDSDAAGVTGLLLVVLGVAGTWLIALIDRGSNSARRIMLVLVAVGWLAFIVDPALVLEGGPAAFILDVGTSIVAVYAMYLLFFGDGGRWFKAQ